MTDKVISPLRRRLIEGMAICRLDPKTQLERASFACVAMPAEILIANHFGSRWADSVRGRIRL
jgi:hypothetical protein